MEVRCSRCVTPASWPGIRFDSQGVCNLCQAFDKRWSKWLNSKELQAKSRSQFDTLITKAKRQRRGKYDLMVPISGGKDSLYALYWIKKTYDVSVLTYTYDNGLFDARALRNIEIAKERMGVDHVMETLPFQKDLLGHFFKRSGNFCGACVIPYLIGAYRCAKAHDVNLLIFGLSKRTDVNMPDGMNPFYFFNVVQDGFGPQRFHAAWGRHPVINYITDAATQRVKVVNLPDYLPWDEAAIQEELVRELGVTMEEEHFDCIGHETAAWLANRRYGFGPEVVKLSQLIRCGTLTREQALARLPKEAPEPPASLTQVAERCGMTMEEVHQAMQRSMKPYFKGFWNYLAIQQRNRFLGR